MTELRRELTLLDATMINVGTMIASAIFIVPAAVAASLPNPSLMLLVWVAGGAVSLLGALCVAELGAALPEAGGLFVYLTRAFGPVWGFLYAWTAALIINPASVAAIAVGFATYVGFFTPLGTAGIKVVAVASIVALTAVNCLGLKLGARVQNVLTLLKIGALGALIVSALVMPGGSVEHFRPLLPAVGVAGLAGAFSVAMVAVLWAYDGWIEITYVGSEVRDPGRNLPRSIVISVFLVVGLYALTNVAYVYVLPLDRMAQSALVGSDAALVLIGPLGAALVAGAIIVSTLGANNGIVLTSARIPYAVSRAGLFFRWMGGVHPRVHTPNAALLAQGGVAAAFALTGTYDQLFTYVVFASWMFYGMSAMAVMRLRAVAPELPRPYRVWGYPVTPVVFILFALWLVAGTIVESPLESGIGGAIILAGVPVYRHWRGRKNGEPA
ncbi:MAG TPA: amino acid permease [Gemmatimonadales bacterium]|nr:amino acid permease [Gemmatimonadales bacterium]